MMILLSCINTLSGQSTCELSSVAASHSEKLAGYMELTVEVATRLAQALVGKAPLKIVKPARQHASCHQQSEE